MTCFQLGECKTHYWVRHFPLISDKVALYHPQEPRGRGSVFLLNIKEDEASPCKETEHKEQGQQKTGSACVLYCVAIKLCYIGGGSPYS